MGHEDMGTKLGNVAESNLQDVSFLPTERRIGTDWCKLVIRVNRKRQLALGLGLLGIQQDVLGVEPGTRTPRRCIIVFFVLVDTHAGLELTA
jgi:hypothetical protein